MSKTIKKHTNNKETNDANEILRNSGKNHKCYKYYSKKETINKIIENRCMYASDGRNWNDLNDYKYFNNSNDTYRFGICFSTYQAESVAMWMLYGGKGKNGAMIDFEKKLIALPDKLINKNIELFFMNNGHFVSARSKAKVKDAYFFDVAYCSEDNRYFKANNDNYIVEIMDSSELKDNIIAAKDYQWHYEKETRLVIEIDFKTIKDLYYRVDCLYAKIDLTNYIDENIIKNIKESPLNDFKLDYVPSKLTGKIEWDLDK